MNRFWMIYSTISQKVIINFENPIVHKLQINSQTKMVLKKYFGVGFFDGIKVVDGILISADIQGLLELELPFHGLKNIKNNSI